MCKDSCKQNPDEVSHRPARALYVHVPFCRRKCRYCDFYSRRFQAELASRFVRAVGRELRLHADSLAAPLQSVFFGGGTPTVLGGEFLGPMIRSIRPFVVPATEVTIEANPATIDPLLADLLVELGVNRVNLGVQSFQDNELRLLGRVHRADEANRAWSVLREAGLANLGLDLIYGIPNQDTASWQATLAEALSLEPEHLSCYALSFEEDTAFFRDRREGLLAEMPESDQRACYDAAVSAAESAGLRHYEISNFARDGRECAHNLTYWHNLPYLALGPAATRYIRGVRSTNLPDLGSYLSALEAGARPPATAERITGRKAMAETLMLGLRLICGVDRGELSARFGEDPVAAFPVTVGRYADLGALVVTERRLRLSREALFVSDTVLADLLAEA